MCFCTHLRTLPLERHASVRLQSYPQRYGPYIELGSAALTACGSRGENQPPTRVLFSQDQTLPEAPCLPYPNAASAAPAPSPRTPGGRGAFCASGGSVEVRQPTI